MTRATRSSGSDRLLVGKAATEALLSPALMEPVTSKRRSTFIFHHLNEQATRDLLLTRMDGRLHMFISRVRGQFTATLIQRITSQTVGGIKEICCLCSPLGDSQYLRPLMQGVSIAMSYTIGLWIGFASLTVSRS